MTLLNDRVSPTAAVSATVAQPIVKPSPQEQWNQLKAWVIDKLPNPAEDMKVTKEQVSAAFSRIIAENKVPLPPAKRDQLLDEIINLMFGYGALDELLKDDEISEIMVNRKDLIYIEKNGKLTESHVKFETDQELIDVIQKIVRPMGREINRAYPKVDARLPDGSRVNAIIPPCAIDGPCITIRKFGKKKLEIKDIIGFGSLTEDMATFLKACVDAHMNIVVSGGTGSGKTTLLNMLSGYVGEGERIVTIEDSAELQLQQKHVVRLETKPAEIDGSGPPQTIRDLVINSLRMRPERIIVGECRGPEALDMLQAMNTGHDGSMTTTHANTPRDAIVRLETLVLMAGMDLPLRVVRIQITKAVDLIVQISRMRDGTRKITHITEVIGLEGETVAMQDVFTFKEEGIGPGGKVTGSHDSLGLRPNCLERLKIAGHDLPMSMFQKSSGW